MTKVIQKRRVFEGRVVNVTEVDLDFENKKKATFEIIEFSTVTGVTALPIMGKEVILIKHYQAGINQEGYSLPTGGLNKGEDPYQRMNEELMEEIGMRSQDLTLMARFNGLPGYIGSEAGYYFIARDLVPEKHDGDEEYTIKIETMSFDRVMEKVKRQEIRDLRTVCALLWFDKFASMR